MGEVRRGGYVIKKEEGAKLQDSTTEEFVKLRSEFIKVSDEFRNFTIDTNGRLKKLTDDIHGIKMQLGRMTKTKKEELNILE